MSPPDPPPLVLASASPRRSELLVRLGRAFVVRVADVDESVLPGEAPRDHVARLSRLKAASVQATADEVVLGADTVVVIDGEIIGKPRDAAHARTILRRLSGRTHEVLTGVALRQDDRTRSTVAATRVTMRDLGPDEIDDYIATGEPMDKAGAYAIQGLGGAFVEAIDGSFDNVVGLPLSVVEAMLNVAPPSS